MCDSTIAWALPTPHIIFGCWIGIISHVKLLRITKIVIQFNRSYL